MYRAPAQTVLILLTCLLASLLLGCSDAGTTVTRLYKFPDTKDVQVQVQINYKIDNASGPVVNVVNQNFLLNAFVFSDVEKQVEIGLLGNAAALQEFPITLADMQSKFDAFLRIPADIQPGPNGYSFHFTLKEQGSSLNLQDATSVKQLEALKGGVQPGAEAASNIVPLSIATTLAYRLTREVEVDDGSPDHVTVYESMASKLAERLDLVGAKLDPTKTTDLATYSSALEAALKVELVSDETLQLAIAEALRPAVLAKKGDAIGPSFLATTFTNSMKSILNEARPVLVTNGRLEPGLFKSGTIDPNSVPNPDTYVSGVFAPAPSIVAKGGNTIADVSWPSIEGAESYIIYWSTDSNVTKSSEKITASSAALRHTDRTNGTNYYYAVASIRFGIEGPLSQVARAVPVGAPTGINLATASTTATLSWTASPAAANYTIRRGITSGAYPVEVATTSSLSYTDTGLTNTREYFYQVTANSIAGEAAALEVNGTPRWLIKQIDPSSGYSEGAATVVDSSNNTIAAGTTTGNFNGLTKSSASADSFLVKYDERGNVLWTKLIGGNSGGTPQIGSLAVDASGNIFVAGTASSGLVISGTSINESQQSDADAYLLKVSPSGDVLWHKYIYGNVGGVYAFHPEVAVDSAGSAYFSLAVGFFGGAGTFGGLSSVGDADSFIFKYVADGTAGWTKVLGVDPGSTDPGNFYITELTVANTTGDLMFLANTNGDYENNGTTRSTTQAAVGRLRISDGQTQWISNLKTVTADTIFEAEGIASAPNGGVYVAVENEDEPDTVAGSPDHSGTGELAILHVNSSGQIVWSRQLGTVSAASDIDINAIAASSDGSVYVAGSVQATFTNQTITGSWDTFIVKFDSSGTIQWNSYLGVTGQNFDCASVYTMGNDVVFTGRVSVGLDGNANPGNNTMFVGKYYFGDGSR